MSFDNGELAAAMAVALDRSASATFSAVNSGTAGMGLEFADDFPNVMIFGCTRTWTGTGAAAKMAVERYALVAMDARVYAVPTESRFEYMVSRSLYRVSRWLVAKLDRSISSAEKN